MNMSIMSAVAGDLWLVFAGAAVFVVMFVTGLKMRVLWGVFLVALIGACVSLVMVEPSAANVEAWRWFSVPFALFPITAGLQNRSPMLPLLVGILGGGLSIAAFLRANEATWHVLLFPVVTVAVAYALYGLCRVMRPSEPEHRSSSDAPRDVPRNAPSQEAGR